MKRDETMKGKEPPIPPQKSETIRRKIMEALEGHFLSARELSQLAGISEKDVHQHLEHIRRTVSRGQQAFVIKPAACNTCGFQFRSRKRSKKPGKCPVCRSEYIEEPLFAIKMRKKRV
jgi:predicted Zn-ribbon and HTH transcriptional regulator